MRRCVLLLLREGGGAKKECHGKLCGGGLRTLLLLGRGVGQVCPRQVGIRCRTHGMLLVASRHDWMKLVVVLEEK